MVTCTCECIHSCDTWNDFIIFFFAHLYLKKTGTSFANTVYRTACADFLPSWAVIRTLGVPASDAPIASYFEKCWPARLEECQKKKRILISEHSGPHMPLSKFSPATIAYVTILREPLQRKVIKASAQILHSFIPLLIFTTFVFVSPR